ncbi:MAG: hypothetical protein WB952_23950 [Terriglobales bacterium]
MHPNDLMKSDLLSEIVVLGAAVTLLIAFFAIAVVALRFTPI